MKEEVSLDLIENEYFLAHGRIEKDVQRALICRREFAGAEMETSRPLCRGIELPYPDLLQFLDKHSID